MQQLSMMDILCPPPPPPPMPLFEAQGKREVVTRAYGKERHIIEIRNHVPDPVEVEIRGIRCLVVFDFGASIYTVDPPGSPFWSCTGFRSMATGETSLEGVIAAVEAYIDAPRAKYGLGGKPEIWWPGYISQWQGDVSWSLSYKRSEVWTQWGPERHAEIWRKHDGRIAEAEARMWAEGIDPNRVGPPRHHKGKNWPTITRPEA